MKYVEAADNELALPTVELTRRNLKSLLVKLDDPESARTLVDPDDKIAVKAVEDAEHYADRQPGTVYMPTPGQVAEALCSADSILSLLHYRHRNELSERNQADVKAAADKLAVLRCWYERRLGGVV